MSDPALDDPTPDAPLHAAHPRHAQMFPVFAPEEMERLARFGSPALFPTGRRILGQGDVGAGLVLVRAGRVEVAAGAAWERRATIIAHGPGQFVGELAQLSDRPALVEAVAVEPVDAVVIPATRLRDLIVQEAELGERVMRALILRRAGLLEGGAAGPIIVGDADDPLTLRLQESLRRNGHPHRALDSVRDVCAQALVQRFDVDPRHLPIVILPDGGALRRPDEGELARRLGLLRAPDPAIVHDVAIVGAGPAGLSAAVYAASDGMSVLALDARSFGGQAGASARIENFLGFPTGISGLALTARAYSQAQKFGVEFAIPEAALTLTPVAAGYELGLENGERATARTVVIATGARYRRLGLPDLERHEGVAAHYWASPIEARLCGMQDVALVGGGNSAGQAAVFLAGRTRKVSILARRDLAATMSRYLVERIHAQPNIEVHAGAEVAEIETRDGAFAGLRWRGRDGSEGLCPCRHVFLFIGAEPNTGWLRDSGVALDARGFVISGAGGAQALETSLPGVFAIGDVRSGSEKRVAAAVGEGAQVAAAVAAHLQRRSAPHPAAAAGA